MRIFFDSSSLAKRYVKETGTEEILAYCHDAESIIVSIICLPEIISAFNRLKREGLIGKESYDLLKANLEADIADAFVINLNPEILKTCVYCLEKSKLRGMDAIHLASAVHSDCDLFISSDKRQCEAAKTMGLKVVTV
ncbi:MAG: type II toxin-antitoxin system VapC family toxin [Lentisphaerota bacterium]